MALAQERADTRLAGFNVEVLPSIDSTNTELMRRARAGQLEPTLLVAEHQSAGRGRLGRHWESAQGSLAGGSLTFSLGMLVSPHTWYGLSLAVGVSVAQNIAGTALAAPIQLKWPNDLWWQDRKLAGILIETVHIPQNTPAQPATQEGNPRYVVIGVGVNIAPRSVDGLSTPPAWLQELQPGTTAAQALGRVAAPLLRDVLEFEAHGFGAFASRYAARDALRGRHVAVSDGQQGLVTGVDDRGLLLVQTAQGVQRIASSEVSVRPV